jgi:ribosomal protein S14
MVGSALGKGGFIPTVNEILREMGISAPHMDHMASQHGKVTQMPKDRRCETCLSYSDFTTPVSIELCRKCVRKLVGRTEKQYIPQMSMKRFNCDLCGAVTVWKTIINPVVCKTCFSIIMKKTEENYREFLKSEPPPYVVKHK